MDVLRALVAAAALLAAQPAQAAHWNVDAARSRLGFSVLWAGRPFAATFKTWRADIDFDPADLSHSSADVLIDIASESSGDAETDAGVKGAQGFQASQFATARFRTAGFTRKSADHYEATAKLTIRGVTRTVTLPFTLTIAGDRAHMTGTADVLRTDFGIGTGGDFSKPEPVAYEVSVQVDLTAWKAP